MLQSLQGYPPPPFPGVINGTANVDPEKKKRVLQAVEETGFVPNEVARSLFRKSARLIGLIIPNLVNPFFTQLAAHIDTAAAQSGYRVFLCSVDQDDQRVKSSLQMLMSMNADGVVLAVSSPEIQSFLPQFHIPIVAVDCMQTTDHVLASFYCDYYQGGRMAMEHLLSCGCRKVVCIRSDQNQFSARMRYLGYSEVCKEQGIQEFTLDCDYNFRSGLEMTRELLEVFPDADGILACNDIVAASTFKVLHSRAIRVPEQMQLVGFDDIFLSRLVTPELTTIRQPIQEMAHAAVDYLVNQSDQQQVSPRIFPVTLMVRETTRPR